MLAAALHGALGASVMRRDVVVVGAGPAGAVAAREIARLGASVLLVDRSAFPRRKVCGACLSAGAADLLESVGLGGLPAVEGAVPLRALVLRGASRAAHVRLTGGYALSRYALDRALVDAAAEAGAEVWTRAKATLGPPGDHVRAVRVDRGGSETEVRSGVVIDATGLGRGLSGSTTHVAQGSRMGLGAVFDDAAYPVQPGELHMAVGRSGYVGLVRVEGGGLNVAAAVDPSDVERLGPSGCVANILSSTGLPPLRGRRIDRWRGTPLLTRSPGDVGAERLLRIGDAAGYVEPFTGEGMCWSISAATAVAPLALEAVEGWRAGLLETWRRYNERTLGRARLLCRVLAPALRRPGLVAAAVVAVGLVPTLAAPFVRRAARAPSSTGRRAA